MSENRLKVFSGNSNKALAEDICRSIGVPLGQATVTSFPDGETFVKIDENIRGQDVFIIQSTCPPSNQHLMELLIMIDAARRASANRITAVLPFYGYARQDRKDQPRVPITAKLVANLLVSAGANRVLTMDLHSQQIQGFFDIPVDHLYASPVFFDYLSKEKNDNLVVCSPDVGGMKMAAAYADMLGVTWKLENIGHSKRHVFPVKWVKPDHPICRGLPPVFMADDELYHKLDFKPNVEVLATAFSDPKMGGTGKDEPIIWTVPFGQGKVVHITLGHDLQAMSQPGFIEAFTRVVAWAATD